MNDNKGFITIMSLIIMTIILISTLYLMYTYSLEYMIINSTINSIQSSYLSESKLYLVLNENKYYNKFIPSIEKFIKDYNITSIRNISVSLDQDDLIEGDTYNKVTANIFHDYDGRIILELNTKSTQNKITKEVVAKVTVLNELYELGIPILSNSTLDKERKNMFTEYMDFLEKNLVIPKLDEGIYGIFIKDFEEVKIINDANTRIIEYYRNDAIEPIRVDKIVTDSIFILCKDNSKTTELSLIDLDSKDEFKLSGIIYLEGNLIVQSNFELDGIMIINGNLTIDPLAKITVNGIMLHKGNDEIIENKGLKVNYDSKQIRKHIVYLPEFIDLNIRSIKVY